MIDLEANRACACTRHRVNDPNNLVIRNSSRSSHNHGAIGTVD